MYTSQQRGISSTKNLLTTIKSHPGIMWDSILLHFEQELFADRSSIPDDQVGYPILKAYCQRTGNIS